MSDLSRRWFLSGAVRAATGATTGTTVGYAALKVQGAALEKSAVHLKRRNSEYGDKTDLTPQSI